MSKLNKAIDKGKGRKALFGSKKLKGDLEGQLAELGLVLENHGVIDMPEYLGSLGIEPATTATGTAIASAMPIIKKILDVMKSVGEKIHETAEEAREDGEDVEEADEDEEIQFDNDEVDDGEQSDGDGEDEDEDADEDEDLEGAYFVRDDGELCDIDGLGNITVLGSLGKKDKSAKKAKKAAKKAARKQKKAAKKASNKTKKTKKTKKSKAEKKAEKAAKKQAKKDEKAAKKQAKKDAKAAKKQSKKTSYSLPSPAPAPDAEYTDGGTSTTKKGGKAKDWIKNNLTVDNAAAAMDVVDLFTKKKRGSSSDSDDTDYTRQDAGGSKPDVSDSGNKDKVKNIVKWGAAGVGVLSLVFGIRAIVKSGKKTRKSHLGTLSKIKLK
jgi:hypothetical protein